MLRLQYDRVMWDTVLVEFSCMWDTQFQELTAIPFLGTPKRDLCTRFPPVYPGSIASEGKWSLTPRLNGRTKSLTKETISPHDRGIDSGSQPAHYQQRSAKYATGPTLMAILMGRSQTTSSQPMRPTKGLQLFKEDLPTVRLCREAVSRRVTSMRP